MSAPKHNTDWRWQRAGCRVYSSETIKGRSLKVADVAIGGLDEAGLEARGRLIAAAPDGLEFARAAGGDDGFLLAQIATFIGGWADAARLTGTEKAVAERYYEALHSLSEQGRAFVAKATGASQ